MAKIDIEEVESVLLEKKIDPTKVSEVIKQLEEVVEELKEDRKANALPKQKWEYLIVLNDPDGKIKDEVTGWVIQQREGQDSGLALGKLTDAAKAQNETSKRKKNLITSFGELFAYLKPKFAKEKGMFVKSKQPVRVFVVNGKTL